MWRRNELSFSFSTKVPFVRGRRPARVMAIPLRTLRWNMTGDTKTSRQRATGLASVTLIEAATNGTCGCRVERFK
jgi:hypothetical protein